MSKHAGSGVDSANWARFLTGLIIGTILIVSGIIRIFLFNRIFLFDSIVGVIEILVGLFLIGIGIGPDYTFNLLESIFHIIAGLLGKD